MYQGVLGENKSGGIIFLGVVLVAALAQFHPTHGAIPAEAGMTRWAE